MYTYMNEGELCVLGGRSHEEHITVKMTHGQEFKRRVCSLSLWVPAEDLFLGRQDIFTFTRKEFFVEGKMFLGCGSELQRLRAPLADSSDASGRFL